MKRGVAGRVGGAAASQAQAMLSLFTTHNGSSSNGSNNGGANNGGATATEKLRLANLVAASISAAQAAVEAVTATTHAALKARAAPPTHAPAAGGYVPLHLSLCRRRSSTRGDWLRLRHHRALLSRPLF